MYQTETMKLKNTITELKDRVEGFQSSLNQADKMIRELEERLMGLSCQRSKTNEKV